MATIRAYTNLSQSEKLKEILSPESADMKWHFWKDEIDAPKTPTFGYSNAAAESYKDTEAVYCPAWSLAALLSVLPEGTRLLKSSTGVTYHCDCPKGNIDKWYNNPVDACYEMIIKLHKQKHGTIHK